MCIGGDNSKGKQGKGEMPMFRGMTQINRRHDNNKDTRFEQTHRLAAMIAVAKKAIPNVASL